eukprot:1432043-Pyramimonas_sp.AAC.1
MAADPKYLSVGPQEYLGLGATPIAQTESTTSARLLEDLHILCRRMKRTPILGNLAWGVSIAKHNGKVGTLGKRLINVMCPYWKCFYGGLLKHNLYKKGVHWPAEFHGFLPRRRREDAIAVQMCMGHFY